MEWSRRTQDDAWCPIQVQNSSVSIFAQAHCYGTAISIATMVPNRCSPSLKSFRHGRLICHCASRKCVAEWPWWNLTPALAPNEFHHGKASWPGLSGPIWASWLTSKKCGLLIARSHHVLSEKASLKRRPHSIHRIRRHQRRGG